jgi:sugar-specific transcriptional regulator TrmB
MVTNQNVLDALKQIGLNLYERKLWVALLSRGSATAGELSSLAKVPHSRTYDVLESLAEKGFVVIQTSKPLKYVAIEPKESLERAKKKITDNAQISVDRISGLQKSNVLKELDKTFKSGVKLVEPGNMTGSLKGRKAMHTQLDTLFRNAKNHISIVSTGESLNEIHTNHGEILKKASSKGVKVRIATTASKEAGNVAKRFKGIAEVKKLGKNHSRGRFVLVDGSHAVISLTDDKSTHPSQDVAFWSQGAHVAGDVFGPMFNSMWGQLESF